MTDNCLSHLHGDLRHWSRGLVGLILVATRQSKNFLYHVCLSWHSHQREQQKNIYLRKSLLSQNGPLWDVTLLSSIFWIITAWLHHTTSRMHFQNKQHLMPSISCEYLCLSSAYLGGRPARALFRQCGVLSVSAVDRGTSGVSAFESPSHSPSASPWRPSLSSPSASCQDKDGHTDIEILSGRSDDEKVSVHLTHRSEQKTRRRQQSRTHVLSSNKEKGSSQWALLRSKCQWQVTV